MSCPNLALVHTSIEHSRDWCRRLLILGCQEPYAHQALHPVRWCGRLLKTTVACREAGVHQTLVCWTDCGGDVQLQKA
ncbi:hypothetical protein FIV37_24395 [Pseudomonas gessardii]|nr:hypothetical protein [Pseudomonas gessardii]